MTSGRAGRRPSLTGSIARGTDVEQDGRVGTLLALAAYGIWGVFPLYFHALLPSGPWEILAHRILWTLVFCVLVLLIQRDGAWIRPLLRRPRMVAGLGIAALLIAGNWVIYVAAVTSGHTSDAALGYFLNPLITVALGVALLKERLRPMQWVAVGVGLVAGVYLSIVGGSVPWIALSLAMTFGLYGLTKKRLGATLPAMHGLTVETALLAPVAVVTLAILGGNGDLTFGGHGGWHTTLLVGSGIATALPLLAFAAAARRIPLVTIGLIQFITPVMQLLCAVLFLDEHMSSQRWIGFGIVWVALIILSIDSLMAARRNRRSSAVRAAEAEAAADEEFPR